MPPLMDVKIGEIARAFERAGIPYAFGGAIALAFYATPRATEDVDVNVFVGIDEADRCLAALGPLGVTADAPERAEERGALTIHWEHTPIRLFFAYDPFHESCRARARIVPFGAHTIRVLAAEDITIFKVVYDRPRDRAEVREVLLCMGERFDLGYALAWLERLLGADDPRLARFRESAADVAAARPA
jgi:hypothetical protein